jgi:ferredoxin-NADP reductase
MYRLVLYVLLGYLTLATLLSSLQLLPFPPLLLLASTIFLVIMCWAANTVLAWVLGVPTNVESAFITALILALIFDPAQSPDGFQLLGWAAILAMASKYLLALNRKHLFNPAAIAAVITAFALGESASWWVATLDMLPLMLVGGWLVARKMRQEDVAVVCCLIALAGSSVLAYLQGASLPTELRQVLVTSPLFFFSTIMVTEPLTAPPTKQLCRVYAGLTGLLFVPQIHLGPVYSTPELALVVGNVFSYLVSPKLKVMLKLNRKVKLAPEVVGFLFKPSQELAYAPGQYMEFTLDHPHPDSRGNRRYFTLASSPTEKYVHLGIRYYERSSSFKQAMYHMDGKTKLLAGQIAGDFTLPPDPTQKLVFIAGGIGITPFRSMLKYLLDVHERRDIILLYINKTAKEIVYGDILHTAQAAFGLKTFYSLTDTTAVPRTWPGFVGRLNGHMIQHAVPDYQERTYYVSGPLEMVRTCECVLKSLHVRHDRIKKDFFPGLL